MTSPGPVLTVDNVGKSYRKFSSELHRFARWVGIPIGEVDEHWVVRHIAFKVNAGEAVGIIGQNGAGKSTLLKMIAGTSQPSEGACSIQGRVSALLELGLGFNGELTGRENAIYSAGLMGVDRGQIDDLLPDIEAFAEIGEYFDQPMRTYSSGMQMRVAFSVATAIRPDILIVDEALAVGDAYFVHKCFQRIREFREAGTTLLIVSHDATAVQALCDRAVLIDGGRLILDGAPQQVFDYYNAMVAEKESGIRTELSADGRIATESGSGEAFISELQLLDGSGKSAEYVGVGGRVALRAKVEVTRDIPRLVFGYMIRDRLGQPMYGTNTAYTDQVAHDLRAGQAIEFFVEFNANLGAGSYSVSVSLASAHTHLAGNYFWKDLALMFTVANVEQATFVGSAWLPPVISIAKVREQTT